jgi:hypothetical protein
MRLPRSRYLPTPVAIEGIRSDQSDPFGYGAWPNIDCYKKGLTPKDALAQVDRLIQNGTLPPPSFGLQSQGGLFWVPHTEKDPAKPTWREKGIWPPISRF